MDESELSLDVQRWRVMLGSRPERASLARSMSVARLPNVQYMLL